MDGNSITGNLLLQGPVGGNMLIVSKQDTANALGIYTPSGGADALRLLIGNSATAVATWSNVTHTGMVMSGDIAMGANNINNAALIDLNELRSTSGQLTISGIASADSPILIRNANTAQDNYVTRLTLTSGDAATATWNAVTHTGLEITSGSNITFGTSAIIAGSGTDTFLITGHFKPVANKTWDMGSTGLRWRDVFTANAVSSGTSRIVETSSICPKCEGDIPTVRSTGGILSVGDEYDYTESHCPVCLTMVVEKLNQRPDIEIDNPESIVLTDVIVKAQSGNTRSIGLKFLFNDTDINVGYLSENEIQIFENGDNDAIENIIKDVAMDEWRSLKRAELMETHTKELGEQFKDYTSDWLGKEININ
jgi:hypothetical protein